jgi:hypothetical protein
MKKYLIIAAIVTLGTAMNAQAFVSFSATLTNLNDSSNVGANGKTVAVIDRDGDMLAGFGDLNANDGSSFLFDADDIIVEENGAYGTDGVWDAAVAGGVLVSTTYSFDLGNGIDPGDKVYVFYFPGLPSNAPAPGFGQEFGVVEVGVIPNDQGALSVFPSGQSTTADFTTVPEPASFALLGLGGLLIARRRK